MHMPVERTRMATILGGIALLVQAALTGCAIMNPAADPLGAIGDLVHVAGTLNEIKTVSDIKSSFVLRSSELLFPDRLTISTEALPALTVDQQEEVSRFLAGRIEGLYALTAAVANRHEAYKSALAGAPRLRKVKFLVTGKPEAVVDTTGTVFIDVRTVQAILRSVIIEWAKSGGIAGSSSPFALLGGFGSRDIGPDGPTLSAQEEARSIDEFNTYRRLVRTAAPSAELGFWYQLLTQSPEKHDMERAFGKGFFNQMADRAFSAMEQQLRELTMLAAARHAQETFESALDFLIAHEIAHQVFSHAPSRETPPGKFDGSVCTAWQQQELMADEFASVVLAQRQYSESKAATVRESANGFERLGDGFMPTVGGRSLVLSTAYRLAGFSDELVRAPCRYPTPRERMARSDMVFKVSNSSLATGLYFEGLQRGDWLRSKDEARLGEVLEAADLSPQKAVSDARWFDSAQLSRVRGIVQTMARDRFKGRL